jgi:hypothetical protein
MALVTVVCLKWGDKYSAEYVNRLRSMVRRHLSVPHEFVCFTDGTSGLEPDIATRPIPDPFDGWWNKLSFFRGDLFPPGTTLLYSDLDMVIVKSIDFLLDGPETYKPCLSFSGWVPYNGSVMRITAGAHVDIYSKFAADPDPIRARHMSDQEWIGECLPGLPTFPPEKIISFKWGLDSHFLGWTPIKRWSPKAISPLMHALPAPPWMTTPAPGPDVAMIAFHGRPNPPDVIDAPYGPFKKAPWIAEDWR